MKNILTLILGGGAGTRLYPLTKYRAKPAVPVAGKYRLIDIAVSNCINSDLKKIFVLTQYLSASLNRHVAQTYAFDPFKDGFAHILAAEQRADDDNSWFQGTADAVRKHWGTFDNYDCDHIMILPGDALYRMDFRKMVAHHEATNAEITVAVNTVPQRIAHHFGLLKINGQTEITEFREKPKTPEAQAGLEAPESVLEQFKVKQQGQMFLASMGIYLFRRDVLNHYMENTDDIDFGKQILPDAITKFKTAAYVFDGYWEDIGTIDAFYEAHMQFLREDPPFRFADPLQPIFTRPRFLPSSRLSGAHLDQCVIADGCNIGRARVNHSVIGLRCGIGDHTTIDDSILMGADYYNSDPGARNAPGARKTPGGLSIPIGIGKYCHIRRAIIDKNVRMGDDVKILNEKNVREADGPFYHIREGIVIIPKNAIVPTGTII